MKSICFRYLILALTIPVIIRSYFISIPEYSTTIRKMANSLGPLTDVNVEELVLEYLSASGFSESENAFRREMERNPNKLKSSSSSKSSSRLEDLLEKSYVTQVASGDFFPRKKSRRSHLDAMLMPHPDKVEVLAVIITQECDKYSSQNLDYFIITIHHLFSLPSQRRRN